MPELPEVETVRRGLTPAMLGARIDKVELRRADGGPGDPLGPRCPIEEQAHGTR